MENIRRATSKVFFALFASALVAQASPGPNTVRYSVNTTMTASGVASTATGRVQAFLKQQGNSDHQRLRVAVRNLDPRTSYTLLAQVGTNPDWVAVTSFRTTGRGAGHVMYFQSRFSRPDGRHALPEALDPLTDVRQLAVANANGEIVLSVNLHESEAMAFELTSVFNNTGSDPKAIGCVAVACQNGSVQFRLFAAGQSSEYIFCVNDAPVETYLADGAGRISVGAFPSAAPSPLLFKKLDMRNGGNAVVLQSDVR